MTKEQIMELDLDGIEKRTAELLTEIDTVTDPDALTPLNEEMDVLEERKAELREQIEKRKKDIEKVSRGAGDLIESGKDVNKMPDLKEIRNSKEYIDAFAEYVKTGNDRQCRALASGNATEITGTVPVPEFVYDIVKTAWENNEIMSLVRRTNFRGNLKVGFEISGSDAVVHAEGSGAVDEEELLLGIALIIPKSIKKWISISDEVYDMRGEEFLRYIYDELAHKIFKKAADELLAIILGTSTQSGDTPAIGSLEVTELTAAAVINALGLLSDEATEPVLVMSKTTEAALKVQALEANYAIDPFQGLRVVHNNNLGTSVIVGDFGNGAIANFPNGDNIDFKFDEMSRKKEDLIEVLGRLYVGLGVVAPSSFVVITVTGE